jgi:molybdopterin-guanine dinucleotide biosynthesis protein A
MTEAAVAVGFAVAGGASRRMGRDKALLPWGDATLLDHTLDRLREPCADVRILCGPEPRYAHRRVPIHVDLLAGAGPLAGVLTALRAIEAGYALVLAVDLPFVPPALLHALLALAPGHDVVVPVTADGPHPLCAVYARACIGAIEGCLARGERKMTAFWPEVRVRAVAEVELRAFGDPSQLLRNLNTAEDYRAARG